MALETSSSSCASSSSQSNDAPKELLQLLGILKKQQLQRQQQQEQQQLPNPIKLLQQQHDTEEDNENPTQQQHVELSQIELIYRAEGNANLVLALPQFKKVLRLPKIQKRQQQEQQYPNITEYPLQNKQQQQLKQTDMTSTGQRKTEQQIQNAAGILTMDHYVAYIDIIRCLLGNEFVYEADVVAVPNPNDRDWINGHIRPYRPVNRLDKEFGGHYGLLLPDATGLPAEFDILLSNLQKKIKTMSTPTTLEATECCGSHVGPATAGGDGSGNIFGDDTYAIEIKPKQGWLLPNDVYNLFDIKPTLPVSVPPAVVASSNPCEGPLKISTDKQYFTDFPGVGATTTVAATCSSLCSLPSGSASTASSPNVPAKGNDKELHLLPHNMGHNIRCRYCSMQHLKLKQQKINKLGDYCPLDLFSGVPARMLKALEALLTCPQNNLRIFKNGILIYDDKINRLSKIDEILTSDQLQIIKHLLQSCLLREYEYTEQQEEKNLTTEDNVKLLKQAKNMETSGQADISEMPHSLITCCASKRPKINTSRGTAEPETANINPTQAKATTVQLSLAHSSVSSTAVCSASACDVHCHDWICPTSDVSVQQMKSPEMPTLPKNCILQKVLHLQLLAKRNFPYMLDHKYQVKMEKSYDGLRKLLKKFAENANKLETSQLESDQQYLLAATALDCSIMVTFRSLNHPRDGNHFSLLRNPHVICMNDQKFVTKVTLLDLDPKPDSHFAKYCTQTKEIADVLVGKLITTNVSRSPRNKEI